MITLAVLGLGVMAAFALFYFSLIRPLEQALAPATAENAAVEVLAGDPDAVILMPFVTGDVPRLLTGDALESRRKILWYTQNVDAGNVVGGVIFGMMGLPPVTELATGFRGGVAVKVHDCVTIGCQGWHDQSDTFWGMGVLRGRGDALGPEATLERQSFADHAAYLAAHAAVLADPLQWFAQPGAEVALPGDDGLRLLVISLPTEVLAHAPVFGANDEDPAREAELTALAEGLVEGTGGTVESVLGTAPMPIWVISEGMPLFDAGGALRALPDLTFRNPVLRLSVPEAGVAVVQERLDALAFPGPDGAALAGAVRAAFAGWGLDPDCLPGCGGVDTDLRDRVALDAGPAPFWVLDVWHVPKGG